MAEDEYYSVRIAVAENKNTPKKVLEKLLNDKYPRVRDAARKALKDRLIKRQKQSPSTFLLWSKKVNKQPTANSKKNYFNSTLAK